MNYRKLAEVTSLGMSIPAAIVVGLFFGSVLDKWLGTKPWMLMIWTVLGAASGILTLIRGIRKYEKDEDLD